MQAGFSLRAVLQCVHGFSSQRQLRGEVHGPGAELLRRDRLEELLDSQLRQFVAGLIDGAGAREPVIELLQSHRAHEDFSSRASWIKEDFERTFHSKRAKLKVELVETLDDAPVWSTDECEGYGEVLFRDLVAALDLRERRLLLALRMGKTVTEISADEGLNGHGSISQRVAALKEKVAVLLN